LTLINKFCILRKIGGYMSLRYRTERFFDRYNHLMEFIRTILAIITVTLQLVILSRLV